MDILVQKIRSTKRLDRMRVLKESLLAVNRGFNKNQTNWYVDLLTALEPAENECLQLQNELFSVFHCPQNKPISYVLKIINSLSENPEFDYDAFINHLPIIFPQQLRVL